MKLEEFVKGARKKRRWLNRELFRRTAARLRQNPKIFDQDALVLERHRSGLTVCLVGEFFLEIGLTVEQIISLRESEQGRFHLLNNILGLEHSQGRLLWDFSGKRWPEPYRARFYKSKGQEEKADVAALMLDAIADGKVKL